jgi:hypothetical protein
MRMITFYQDRGRPSIIAKLLLITFISVSRETIFFLISSWSLKLFDMGLCLSQLAIEISAKKIIVILKMFIVHLQIKKDMLKLYPSLRNFERQ